MKTCYLCLLGIFLQLSLFAQQANYEWAIANSGNASEFPQAMTTDLNNAVIITGAFEDTVDFDPGPAQMNLISNGFRDCFIQKLDANGNLLWVKQIGGTLYDRGRAVTTDAQGNIYVTGTFENTVDLDPGTATNNVTSVGENDVFLLKLDPNGNYLWSKTFGGVDDDRAFAIYRDSNGDFFLGGSFRMTTDFDPDAGTANQTANGGTDAFILKLDSSANYQWVKTLGGSGTDIINTIKLDTQDNVIAAGYYNNSVDFDPGTGTANQTSNGSTDAFVLKLDGSGNYQWVKTFGGSSSDDVQAIVVDASNQIYSIGNFYNIVDFDPNAGISMDTSRGSRDAFIHKMDENGNLIWVKTFGGSSSEYLQDLAIDGTGNLYTIGYYQDTVDFDPNAGVNQKISNGASDIYIQKLSPAGNLVWVTSLGGTDVDFGNYLGLDQGNNILISGSFYSANMDFDPGSGTALLSAANNSSDIFVAKYNQCVPTAATDVITACNSYTWIDGNSYTSSNNSATFTLTNAAGCDSVVTLDLTINQSTTGTDVITACDSYTWIDGNSYTSSNNSATFTLTNAAGCDSVVTLDLTINQSTTGTDVITACDSYTWIDGNSYTSSNNSATFTLTNAAGCDSVVTLDLTINTVNTAVTQNSNILMADLANASYQWIDCSNNNPISGATGQSFTATQNGDYAVIITTNNCTDTSSCTTISTVGVTELPATSFHVFPNPSSSSFTIERETGIPVTILLYSAEGRLVYSELKNTQKHILLDLDLPAGSYYLQLRTAKATHYAKLLKK